MSHLLARKFPVCAPVRHTVPAVPLRPACPTMLYTCGSDYMACNVKTNCYQPFLRSLLSNLAKVYICYLSKMDVKKQRFINHPLSLGSGWEVLCCGEVIHIGFLLQKHKEISGMPTKFTGLRVSADRWFVSFINLFQATQLISEHKETLVAHELAFSTIIYKRDKKSIYNSNLLHSI